MSFKIKASRSKIRRRGERLIVTTGDERLVLALNPDRTARRVVEAAGSNEHWALSYSPCGRFAIETGHCERGPMARAINGDFFEGERIAIRLGDDPRWIFFDDGELFVSIDQTGIENIALAAGVAVGEIDHDLAGFLGISPVMCAVDAIEEIHRNPRWRALREFKFKLTRQTEPIGVGRQAENTVRHRLCNYDQMLRECGVDGLLWPDQYARVRKGVDRLVADAMKNAAGARP
jgi:hypothetical protein